MRSRHLLVLALVGAVAACDARDDAEIDDTDVLPGAEAPATPEPAPVTGDDMIVSRGDFEETEFAGDRDISGTAELRHAMGTGTTGATGGPLELRVRLEGLTGEHAWHVHRGPCSNVEAPIAVPSTEPLRATTGGAVEQTLQITSDQLTQQQLESEEFSVRVHEGGTDQPGQAIACANIQRR